MTAKPFAAIIFDHDGTLVDTERPDFEACRQMCHELQISLTKEVWAAKVLGRMQGYNDLYAEIIQPNAPHFSIDQMWGRLHQLWPLTLEQTQLMPGVTELLPQLQALGYVMGVATAADRDWANRWLGQFNLLPYFQVIASSSDVVNNKPAPDVYLHAAAKLGVAPEQCLVFEDSLAGATAAKAAGMTVVAVPIPGTNQDFGLADAQINSLQVVSPAWINSLGGKIARGNHKLS